MVQLRTIMNTD